MQQAMQNKMDIKQEQRENQLVELTFIRWYSFSVTHFQTTNLSLSGPGIRLHSHRSACDLTSSRLINTPELFRGMRNQTVGARAAGSLGRPNHFSNPAPKTTGILVAY